MSFSRISTLALALAVGLASSASANIHWNLTFFDTAEQQVGTGTIVTGAIDPSANSALLTAISATVLGPSYSSVRTGSFLSVPTAEQVGVGIVGVFFKENESLVFNTGVLQMFFGRPTINSLPALDARWAISSCSAVSCPGGGTVQGRYSVTRAADPKPPVIPLPASAALLPLGLVALGAYRRLRKG